MSFSSLDQQLSVLLMQHPAQIVDNSPVSILSVESGDFRLSMSLASLQALAAKAATRGIIIPVPSTPVVTGFTALIGG